MDLKLADRANVEYLISQLEYVTKLLYNVRPFADSLKGEYPDTNACARAPGDVHCSMTVLERLLRDLRGEL